MNYLLYAILAIFISFVWLFFFLRRDNDPESKRMIALVFVLGAVGAVIAGCLQEITLGLFSIELRREMGILFFLIYHFIIISFIEEISKYFVVKISVIDNSEFDEPVDAMIYMITAALGFAALENFIYLVRYEGIIGDTIYHYAIYLGFLRFLGSTLLHALSSATLGFFMAISFLKIRRRKIILFIGILLATLLHAFYNLFIINVLGYNVVLTSLLLISLSIFILFYAFWKIKKIKSICQI